MRTLVNPLAEISHQSATAAANTAVAITLPADPEQCHVVCRVDWSYDGAPTGGKVTITAGSTTLRELHIVEGGPGLMDWYKDLNNPGIHNDDTKGEAVTVTLTAGGASVVGTLGLSWM